LTFFNIFLPKQVSRVNYRPIDDKIFTCGKNHYFYDRAKEVQSKHKKLYNFTNTVFIYEKIQFKQALKEHVSFATNKETNILDTESIESSNSLVELTKTKSDSNFPDETHYSGRGSVDLMSCKKNGYTKKYDILVSDGHTVVNFCWFKK